MAIEVREARTLKERRLFLYFPEKLYEKTYPQWVHPIYMSDKELLDPKKNRAWKFCDGELFLAWDAGKVVGRIMGIINHKVNRLRNENHARFGFFDCVNDQEVATALLQAVENWAHGKGCDRLVGPMGFTDLDAEGMLVHGFDERPSISTWWHPPYLYKLTEGAGYTKEIDWVTYIVDLTQPMPEGYYKIAERVKSRTDYKLVEFSSRKQFAPYVIPIFELMNEAYINLYGFSPLDEDEIKKVAADYIPLLDPRFVKAVTLDDKLMAFAIGIPDMTPGLRKARGRLFPFGIFQILASGKRSKRLDMLLGAIKEECRGKGLDVLMAVAIHTSARDAGITHSDSHHEMESNIQVRGEMERLGGKVYKRYRVYAKELTAPRSRP